MTIIDLELRKTIKILAAKGLPKRIIARQLDLSEGTPCAITCAGRLRGVVSAKNRDDERLLAYGQARGRKQPTLSAW